MPVQSDTSTINKLLDQLGQRWSLRIIWELRDGHSQTFRLLQSSVEGISPAALNKRVKELRECNLMELKPDGYCLTKYGMELVENFKPLNRWSATWHKNIDKAAKPAMSRAATKKAAAKKAAAK
jgi:DNA-binding HxlR family transcriptional regulator